MVAKLDSLPGALWVQFVKTDVCVSTGYNL